MIAHAIKGVERCVNINENDVLFFSLISIMCFIKKKENKKERKKRNRIIKFYGLSGADLFFTILHLLLTILNPKQV